MKKIIGFLLFSLILFLLYGCPASQFREYKYVGNNSEELNIPVDSLIIEKIKCGYFHSFIGDKEKGLIAVADLGQKIEFSAVYSNKFGLFDKINSPSHYYNLSYNPDTKQIFYKEIVLKKYIEIMKETEGDTITIEFKNGLKYYYRKE